MSIVESTPWARVRQIALATFGLFVLVGATLAISPGEADAWGIRACIESAEVQNAPEAKGLGLSNTFVDAKGNHIIITAGGPTCTLDASTCDSSLNLYLVDDVAKCLAEGAVAGAAASADDAASHAAPAASHAASSGSTLAHTGVEHELAGAFATAIIGAGFAALGLGRSRRRNQ